MTTKEMKLIAFGAGAGILAAILAFGVSSRWGFHFSAGEPSVAAVKSAAATRPEPGAAAPSGTQPGTTVELTPAEITAAGVQVAEVRTAALKTDIAAFGRVEQPEAQLAAVSARIGGRVDKLYVQYTGERVRNGQPVADLYSPEVATAIEEYRLAQENRNGLDQSDDSFARAQADALVRASQRKLELWGVTGKQLDSQGTEGVPHVTIYANAGGTVVDRKVTVNSVSPILARCGSKLMYMRSNCRKSAKGKKWTLLRSQCPTAPCMAMWTSLSHPRTSRRAPFQSTCMSLIRGCACCPACL